MSGLLESLVDALKAQPALLALSVANVTLLLFMFHALTGAAAIRDTMLRQMLDTVQKCQMTPPTP